MDGLQKKFDLLGAEQELEHVRDAAKKEYDKHLDVPGISLAMCDPTLKVVLPEANQLQIDLDTEYAYETYLAMVKLFERYYPIDSMEEHWSKSGEPKRHITITLAKPVTPAERIMLQALLGSDRVRELLGLVRLKNGDPDPTLFLEKK